MLQLRPNCERCDKDLSADSADALICTFECTFCGGNFEARPIRPANKLEKYPASITRVRSVR